MTITTSRWLDDGSSPASRKSSPARWDQFRSVPIKGSTRCMTTLSSDTDQGDLSAADESRQPIQNRIYFALGQHGNAL